MSRARLDSMDSKTQAVLCTDCGGWPATHRPALKQAFCEDCLSQRKL